jgi:sarcosine oxidase subunit beta
MALKSYSALSLLRGARNGHRDWAQAWRNPPLRAAYDAVIIGGGGHGLATAYYLAKQHGMTNIAVLEKGWLGGGNTGRNTAVSRSNYFYPESTRFYDHSLRLYEKLGRELNFNIMLRQLGIIGLASSRREMETFRRWVTSMQLQPVDAELLSAGQIAARVPLLDMSSRARYPVLGGFLQRRGGISRHDAVAWAYARAADALGVAMSVRTRRGCTGNAGCTATAVASGSTLPGTWSATTSSPSTPWARRRRRRRRRESHPAAAAACPRRYR